MILYIDTTVNDEINLALLNEDCCGFKTIKRKIIKAPRQQSEKLLLSIEKIMAVSKLKLPDIKKIIINNHGGSFTSLRIGVITANALAYALNIPVESGILEGKIIKKDKAVNKKKQFSGHSIIEPLYDSEPNIGFSKKLL
jgi:hypothetical protein